MAINSQKFLPSSSSSAIVKGIIKTSAISRSLEESSSTLTKTKDTKEKDTSLSVYKKTVKIDKLLKNNLKLESKEGEQKKQETESKKKEKKEKELETPKKFKGFEILKNSLPKTGILDSVKRFIIFTFAGWLFTRLFQFLPKLLDIVKLITPVYSWFEKGIGMLLEGFVSFIDFGYKAYDGVRDLTKQIGGENFQKVFDDFSSNLNKFLNLAITAAMIAAASGGFGGRGGKTAAGPRVTPRGKPRVTTSGGRPAGRPGLRSPIRQKPTVTTSGGRPAGKFQLPKGAGALTKGARGIIGVGTILDLGIRIASGQPVSKAVVGAAGGAIGAGIGTWLGGAIGGVAGSVVPVIGNLLLGGAGATIGGILGGMLGGGIADSLYDAVTGYGKKNDIQKKATGGLIQRKTRKPPTPQRRRTKVQSPIRKISKTKIQPGKDVGGKKKIEKLYPNPENKLFGIIPMPGEFSWLDFIFGGKKTDAQKNVKKGNIPNAFKALVDTGETLGKSGDWIGALMKAGIQVALGEVPDVKGIASAISQVINAAKSPAMQGIEAIRKEIQGFANGGLVSANSLSSETNTLLLERALEGTIKKRVDDALNSVRKEVRKRGPVGRDEMLEKNRLKGAGPGATAGGGGPSPRGELDISDITADTPEERAFIATIRQLEGTARKEGYNTFFGGSQYGGDLSKKTVSEVKVLQEKFLAEGKGKFSGGKSAAVGAGQFLYPEEIVRAMGLDPDKEKFTPELQNKMILYLAKKKRGIDVTKPLTESDMAVLGKEWASLTPYHGQTGRTGKESLNVYNKFLQNARQNTKELKTKVQGGSKPSGFMTSEYGMRLHPVTGGYKMHQGMDFAGGDFSAGKPISIIKPGQVVDINTDGSGGGYGNFVVVKHDDGTYSFYAHLNEVKVKKGDKLSMESGKYAPVIGTVGSTGVGTGAHLHVEIGTGWNGGVLTGRRDPKDVVDQYLRGGGNVKVEETKVIDEKKQKEAFVAKQKGLNLGYYYKNGKYYQKGGGLFGTDKEIEVTDTKNTWLRTLIPPTTQPTTKPATKPTTALKPQVAGGGMSGGRGSGSSPGGMQGGGFISPSKSNVPNVSSRAYYENPTGSSMLAILPIETIQQVHVPMGGGTIFDSFPIAGLNNSNSSYGLMRG